MTVFALRTADFDARHRVAQFQDVAANVCHLQISPAADAEYRSETVIGVLPDAVMADTTHSACVTLRTSELAVATGDNVLVHIPLSGGFTIRQDGGETVECRPGQIYVDPTAEAGTATFHGERSNVFYISLPRDQLRAGTPALNRLLRAGASMTPQWRMLLAYARSLHGELHELPADHLAHYATHVRDLALIALEADGDAHHTAMGRGVRAARLRAIKADIEANLAGEALGIEWIAGRHGVSARYVRALFAGEDTSFTDYVAHRRLLLAHGMLTDPAHAVRSISDIAMSAGFGDLSWFNARFRRLFGMPPSEMRARAFFR